MILLDTQIVAWTLVHPEKLSPAARRAITEARQKLGLAISDKTLWELAMMVTKQRIETSLTLHGFLVEVERVCTVLAVNSAVAERSVRFGSGFPRDPSVRIIAATAIVHGLKLVTSDIAIRESGEVKCIW